MDRGATFRVLLDYDEQGRFREVKRINGDRTKSVNIAIIPKRCDTMRIRFEGRTAHYETSGADNGFKLFSVSYVVEQGGDV